MHMDTNATTRGGTDQTGFGAILGAEKFTFWSRLEAESFPVWSNLGAENMGFGAQRIKKISLLEHLTSNWPYFKKAS